MSGDMIEAEGTVVTFANNVVREGGLSAARSVRPWD